MPPSTRRGGQASRWAPPRAPLRPAAMVPAAPPAAWPRGRLLRVRRAGVRGCAGAAARAPPLTRPAPPRARNRHGGRRRGDGTAAPTSLACAEGAPWLQARHQTI